MPHRARHDAGHRATAGADGRQQRAQADVEQQDHAGQHQTHQQHERSRGREEAGESRRQGVAHGAAAGAQRVSAVPVAPHQVDEPQPGDEHQDAAGERQGRAVGHARRSFDQDATDHQQQAEQPGTLPHRRPQDVVEIAIEQACLREEQRDQGDDPDHDQRQADERARDVWRNAECREPLARRRRRSSLARATARRAVCPAGTGHR